MKSKIFFITILILLMASLECFGHADLIDISVHDFKVEADGEYTIVFTANDDTADGKRLKEKERKYIVHIRYRAKALAIPVTVEEHKKALIKLKKSLTKQKSIKIWRMSGQGYNPIKGRKGHYRTEALKLVDYNGVQRIMFVHSDAGFYAND